MEKTLRHVARVKDTLKAIKENNILKMYVEEVNTAQRLQSIAMPGQILINETAYKKVCQSFRCKMIGPANVKNKAGEIITYEVLD